MAELGERISLRELAEWMIYYRLEPWGDERADLRAGIVASTVANCAPGRRRKTKPSDFMVEFGKTHDDVKAPVTARRPQTLIEQFAILRAMTAARAKKLKRSENQAVSAVKDEAHG